MKGYEFEGKQVMEKKGISTPRGRGVAKTGTGWGGDVGDDASVLENFGGMSGESPENYLVVR